MRWFGVRQGVLEASWSRGRSSEVNTTYLNNLESQDLTYP